ncbi:MAG: hypothetical protein M0Z53_06100 [Thermaerobacter sp.]|nr:hypothetical protein [Thermaerobacter sp.]
MGVWTITGGQLLAKPGLVPLREFDLTVESEPDRRVQLGGDVAVVPGLVDFHAHIDRGNGETVGIAEPWLAQAGVRFAADAGTYGWASAYSAEAPSAVSRSWVSLLPHGLTTLPDTPRLREVVARMDEPDSYQLNLPPAVLGFKIRLGQNDRQDDEDLLRTGTLWAEHFGLPLMVHWTGTYLPPAEVVGYLRPGDVLTHAWAPLGEQESLTSRTTALSLAKERRIVLDVGHGRNHFAWDVFMAGRALGVEPDTISTDVTRASWQQAPVYDLPHLVGKFIAGGLSPEQAMMAASFTPARYLGLTDSTEAWVFFVLQETPVTLRDVRGGTLLARQFWHPALIIMNGKVMRQSDRHFAQWVKG